MKTILFDPFCGASGDMTIAALIDLGADSGKIKTAMELAANVDVEISRSNKLGISACSVGVSTKKEGSLALSQIIARIKALDLPSIVINDAIAVFNILEKVRQKSMEQVLKNCISMNWGRKMRSRIL